MLDRQSAAASLAHRDFRDDEFWREIPAWSDVSREEFGNHLWQAKNSIRRLADVQKVLGNRISPELIEDIQAAFRIAPMNVRITPYVFSLIDWDNPLGDPLRIRRRPNLFNLVYPKLLLQVRNQMLFDHFIGHLSTHDL